MADGHPALVAPSTKKLRFSVIYKKIKPNESKECQKNYDNANNHTNQICWLILEQIRLLDN